MFWKRLTIDRYAEFERATGARLKHVDGIWWKRIRPFFYRPLYFDTKIVPGSVRAPASPWIGGYQHLVHDPAQANSHMRFLLFENDGSYSIRSLSRNYRKNIAKALNILTVKPIANKDKFIHDAYPVYVSFQARTRYRYLKNRLKPEGFAAWASRVFSFPEILILGAYRGDDLAGVSITYQVEGSIIYATLFCSDAGLHDRASELMLHSIREMAAQSEGIRNIFMGMSGGRERLDQFKTRRGCIMASKPAYLAINPAVRIFLKYCWGDQYSKLTGNDSIVKEDSVDSSGASNDVDPE